MKGDRLKIKIFQSQIGACSTNLQAMKKGEVIRMKIYDISMEVHHDMPVYKGKDAKRPNFSIDSDFNTGSAYETRLDINMHTGTHLDRPLHMIPGGDILDTLRLEQVITTCKVFDFTDVDVKITKEDLVKKEIVEGDFIILKTKNSIIDILEKEFIYLDKTGAQYLRDKKIKGVGIDALGIEHSQPDHESHILLLSNDIVILEGLRLKDILEGEYLLFAAPIKIVGVEAAPVRAVLVEQ